MRTYRTCWAVVVMVLAGVSTGAVWLLQSPWLLVAEVLTIGAMGLGFGATWEEDPARRWAAGRAWATRGLVVAVMLTGLPSVLGRWSLLVIVVVGLAHPELLRTLARRLGRWRHSDTGGRPDTLTDEQLARRWRYSSVAVRSTWRTPGEVLELVQERQRLLDEIERRDPEAFALWLSGRDGRQAQGR